jgi:hypothetical protein
MIGIFGSPTRVGSDPVGCAGSVALYNTALTRWRDPGMISIVISRRVDGLILGKWNLGASWSAGARRAPLTQRP